MSLFASMVQAVGVMLSGVALYQLGGVWVFILVGGVVVSAVGVMFEKQN